MSRISMLFRKLTPLDIMEADLADAQMNRVLAAKELEYLKAMERLYIERIERLSAEIKAAHAASAQAHDYDGIGGSGGGVAAQQERNRIAHSSPSLVVPTGTEARSAARF